MEECFLRSVHIASILSLSNKPRWLLGLYFLMQNHHVEFSYLIVTRANPDWQQVKIRTLTDDILAIGIFYHQ